LRGSTSNEREGKAIGEKGKKQKSKKKEKCRGKKKEEKSQPPPRAKILATILPTFKAVVPHYPYLPILFELH